jgi:hypothetical protein
VQPKLATPAQVIKRKADQAGLSDTYFLAQFEVLASVSRRPAPRKAGSAAAGAARATRAGGPFHVER